VFVEHSFANPKLVVFRELQPARIIFKSGKSPADATETLQLNRICAPKSLSSLFYFFAIITPPHAFRPRINSWPENFLALWGRTTLIWGLIEFKPCRTR
jgi:hypothetical protein